MKFLKKLKDKIGVNRLFFIFVIILYFIILFVNSSLGVKILKDFGKIFLFQVLPLIVFIYFFIFLFSLFVDNKRLKKFFTTKSGVMKSIISVVGGIVSSGPLYLRYPFLKDLKEQGMSRGEIASFIYARAIKIPMLPIMIGFFGLKYTLIFYLVIFIFSFLLGIAVNFVMKRMK